jgi:hypothetical protein
MHIIAIHDISDPEKFFGAAESNPTPDDITLHTVAPNGDHTRAICVWEADSTDAVRDFVEGAVGDVSTNEYFEVDGQAAQGLPGAAQPASAA